MQALSEQVTQFGCCVTICIPPPFKGIIFALKVVLKLTSNLTDLRTEWSRMFPKSLYVSKEQIRGFLHTPTGNIQLNWKETQRKVELNASTFFSKLSLQNWSPSKESLLECDGGKKNGRTYVLRKCQLSALQSVDFGLAFLILQQLGHGEKQ